MKKLIIGIIIGAALASGVFYYLDLRNENEQKKELAEFIANFNKSKTEEVHLNEAMNDPNAAVLVPGAFTIIMAADDQLYYYKGNDCSGLQQTTFQQVTGILKEAKKVFSADKIMVLIKSAAGASFKNSIDILDAITKAEIPPGHFAEVNLTDREKNCITNFKKQ